jgi:hypothetical protein
MIRPAISILSLIALWCAGFFSTGVAAAQTAKDLVGAWTLVSDVNTGADGRQIDAYGPNPLGLVIFDDSGRFAAIFSRNDLPRFASNNRMQGTPEENKAIVQGSLAIFGSYTVADKVITQHIDGGTWPSWTGTDQTRTIVAFTGDELAWVTVPSIGGSTEIHWKRVK